MRLGGRALVALLASILSSTSAGCHSWVPVDPSGLQAALRKSGTEHVQVRSGAQSLVVSGATACEIADAYGDDAYVLSASTSSGLQAWVREGLLTTVATGCECLHAPCTNIDVTNASLLLRKPNPSGTALAVLGGAIGAALLIGLLVMAFFSLGAGLGAGH